MDLHCRSPTWCPPAPPTRSCDEPLGRWVYIGPEGTLKPQTLIRTAKLPLLSVLSWSHSALPPVSSSVSNVVQAAAEDEEANSGEGEDDDDEPGDEELREVRKQGSMLGLGRFVLFNSRATRLSGSASPSRGRSRYIKIKSNVKQNWWPLSALYLSLIHI